MTDIEWKEPPPSSRLKWAPILQQLRDNPGKWALVQTAETPNAAGQTAYSIRSGRVGGAAEGEFETRTSGVEVYARSTKGEKS